MDDLVIDVAPVLRWRRAMEAFKRKDQPAAGSVRQRIEDAGEDPVRTAVGYLEALIASALDTAIDDLDGAAAARALLAEEVLLILTGSDDVEAVRAWLRAH